MLISKKDLLLQTKISYGQLYRWKREGLIPQEWFIKKSSFTGQETYFPKEKILNRIQTIQEMKENYSLEELSKILSPEVSKRYFDRDDLERIDEIVNGLIPTFIRGFGKNTFTFIEVLFLTAISKCVNKFKLQLVDVEELCKSTKNIIQQVKNTDYIFILIDNNGKLFVSVQSDKSEVFLDNRLKKIYKISINDISLLIKTKYRKCFNFKFDNKIESDVIKNNVEFEKGVLI